MVLPNFTITLDRPYEIRMTFKSIVEFERYSGVSLLDRITLSVDIITKFLWVMVKQNEEITIEQMYESLEKSPISMNDVALQVVDAILAFQTKKKAGENPNAKAPAASK